MSDMKKFAIFWYKLMKFFVVKLYLPIGKKIYGVSKDLVDNYSDEEEVTGKDSVDRKPSVESGTEDRVSTEDKQSSTEKDFSEHKKSFEEEF